jgi:hypothetical protein
LPLVRGGGASPRERRPPAPHPFDQAPTTPVCDEHEEEDWEFVDELGPFRIHDCVRLTALPEGLLEDLDEWERPDYLALVGERFEIMCMRRPNIVQIWHDCLGPHGEPMSEGFTMPLELLEAAEWDPEPDV